ncbi:hypothetical protein BD324DRAFT_651306 [Kockovaella imperatae]|uniref:Proteasome assembly chaperone 4 n=1 Tax=Kockovaella imperatae TaxID=4999 RepID=A0A1Y1UIB4_9TREE|nr:hypothetical protein BD324DRAFT_651306 [Kockovaella imperatae]ORX36825.1 hypothetical protein BD324DRAFT_651306 [Kockovaella imperatae]
MTTDLESSITTHHLTVPPPSTAGESSSIPTFHFHLTRLKGTLMIWIGTTTSQRIGEEVDEPESGAGSSSNMERRLASDWAVAMPSRGTIPVSSTSIYQTSTTSIAVSMSQRLAPAPLIMHVTSAETSLLARKYPPHQIHLSLSLPPGLTASSGTSVDPMASRILLLMEKKLCLWLDGVL